MVGIIYPPGLPKSGMAADPLPFNVHGPEFRDDEATELRSQVRPQGLEVLHIRSKVAYVP